MTRLAIQLDRDESAYRAAASRIRSVVVVPIDDAPDAVVASVAPSSDIPVLLVGGDPASGTSKHFPALPWRFCPHVAAIRSSLDAGELGTPGLLRMHSWAPPTDHERDAAKLAAVDLALWLVGEDPDAVHASHNSATHLLHLGFPGGAMAMLDFTAALPAGEVYRSLCLIASHGAAYADDHRDRNLLFKGGAPSASAPNSDGAFIQPMLEDFVAAVRNGRDAQVAQQQYANAEEIARQISA